VHIRGGELDRVKGRRGKKRATLEGSVLILPELSRG